MSFKIFSLFCKFLLTFSLATSTNTPPLLRNESPSLTFASEGDSVELFCEATGVPEPSHRWLKDGFEVFQSDRIQTMTDGSKKSVVRLLIKRFKKHSDAAVYSCHFWNFVGNLTHHMKVIVPEKHWILSDNAFISSPPQNVTVMEGSRVKVTCQSQGFPLNVSQRWFYNGVNILSSASSKQQRMQTSSSDGSLVIGNIDKNDSGWYKCSPTNGIGRAPEAEAYINVTYLPRIVNGQSKVYLARHLQGRLSCTVDANPPMTLVRWFKNGRPVDLGNQRQIQPSADGSHLQLATVSDEDEGSYHCVPYSSLGPGERSPAMQVLVRDPPYFTMRPRAIYQRQPTQSVTMTCQADGDPKPVITWRKAEGEFAVPSKLLHSDGNLTVVNLSKEDQGLYECVASNQVADVVTSALVIVELTTPHPPMNISVMPSWNEIRISWLPAYDGGFPLHYLIWYRSVSSNDTQPWSTMKTTFPNVTSMTIYQLEEDTEYELVVFSRSRLGDGLCSETVRARTKSKKKITSHSMPCTTADCQPAAGEGLKPPKPVNLTAKYVRSHLIISWSLASFSDSNDIHLPIHHFSLQYRTVGQWVPLVDGLMGATSYNWTTASRGVTYQFRVSAYSKLPMESKFVPGEYSDVFTFHTGDPMQSDSPMTDQSLGAVITITFISGIVVVLFFLFMKKLCARINREKNRKGTESSGHVFPANMSDHECSTAMPETESLCKPASKIKETPI